jgi:hypothetical protein
MRLDGRFPALPGLSPALGLLLFLSGGASGGAAAAPEPQPTLPPAVEQARRFGTRVDPALIAADNQLLFLGLVMDRTAD